MSKPTPLKEGAPTQFILTLATTPLGYEVVNFQYPPMTGPGRRPGVRLAPKDSSRVQTKFRKLQEIPNLNRPSHLTLPRSCEWFDINRIHQIQRNALPEFFTPDKEMQPGFQKGQKMYIYYRNTMVSLWRQTPKLYLSTSHCRRVLIGDTCAIMRVHAFLEYWGIINFQSKEIEGMPVVDHKKILQCHVCGNEQELIYVYSKLEADFVVCWKCYQQNLYPMFMEKTQFKEVDLTKKVNKDTDGWTEEENLLLLEQVQKLKTLDNWTEIAKHFPNKSEQKIITHFLKLPVSGISHFSIFENGEDTRRQRLNLPHSPSIFQDIHNPIQSGVAILNHHYKTTPAQQLDEETVRIMNAAKKRCEHLAQRKKTKMDKVGRLIMDFYLHKLECKVAYLHEFDKHVEQELNYMNKFRANDVAQIIKQAMTLNSKLSPPQSV